MPRKKQIDPPATVRRALQRAIRRRESVRVERGGGLSNYYGFPLSIGKQLLLMKDTVDFLADGYVVLPLSQISHIHSGESQRFHDMIISDLQQLRKVRLPAHPVALDG